VRREFKGFRRARRRIHLPLGTGTCLRGFILAGVHGYQVSGQGGAAPRAACFEDKLPPGCSR